MSRQVTGRVKASVQDTHYVSRIEVIRRQAEAEPVALDYVDFTKIENTAALDLIGCEWGRPYSKDGIDCRILGPRTGARKGGHVLVRRPDEYLGRDWPLTVLFETRSTNDVEQLGVDFLDPNAIEWCPLEVVERVSLDKKWQRVIAKGTVPKLAGVNPAQAVAKAEARLSSPVVIEEISLIVDGRKSHSVKEHQSFMIRIGLRHDKILPAVSANLAISRSDGVYVFWQPSGWERKNITGHIGPITIDFDFTENFFGAGDYEVSLFVVDGWSWENIPPSMIYDRRISAFRFSVIQEHVIAFGLINVRVPVKVTFGLGNVHVPVTIAQADVDQKQ